MMRHVFQTVLILMFCIACSEPRQVHTQHNKNNGSTPTTPDWNIVYHRSGGIMGLIQKATISSHGNRTLSNRDKAAEPLSQLNSQQLANLNKLLAELAATPPSKPDKTKHANCRDCITSKAIITYGSQQIQLSNNSDSKSQALLRFLAETTPMH